LARKHLGQLKSIEDQVPASASVYSSHSTSISLPDSGPVSEMTYTVSSGTLNPTIPYHAIPYHTWTVDLPPSEKLTAAIALRRSCRDS